MADRPIRPAGETVLRAFAGEDVGRSLRSYSIGDVDSDDDDLYGRQDFESSVLGIAPPEPGVDGGASADFATNDGLNQMDAAELMGRAAAQERGEGRGLGAESIARLPCSAYGGPEGKECPVCIAAIESEQRCMTLPCGHMFHQECILRWFERQNKCPYCREAVQ